MTLVEIIGNQQVRIHAYEQQMDQLTKANAAFAEADAKQSIEIGALRDTIKNCFSPAQAKEILDQVEDKIQEALAPSAEAGLPNPDDSAPEPDNEPAAKGE